MLWRKSRCVTQATPKSLPTEPVKYPSGIALRTERGIYFLNKDGKRYRIPTERVYQSWRFPLTVDTSEEALVEYPVAVTRLGFRDGTLLNNIADGKIYLVSENRLRQVVDPSSLERLGLTKEDALVVSDAEVKITKMGESIQ